MSPPAQYPNPIAPNFRDRSAVTQVRPNYHIVYEPTWPEHRYQMAFLFRIWAKILLKSKTLLKIVSSEKHAIVQSAY
jgi:hypothetical protein